MSKKHDYKSALEWFNKRKSKLHPADAVKADTIIHALRFAEKMMQEPSEGMCDAGYGTKLSDTYINDMFKAMRDAALKELGE